MNNYSLREIVKIMGITMSKSFWKKHLEAKLFPKFQPLLSRIGLRVVGLFSRIPYY